MTTFTQENRRHVEPAELNRRLKACPEPTAKRKIGLALEGVCLTVAVAAGVMLLAGIAQWAAKYLP